MAAVIKSRSAYSMMVSSEQKNSSGQLTIELNVASTTTSIEDLHVDFALGEHSCVKSYYGQDTLNDLSPYDCCLGQTRAHYKHIDTQVLRAEGILNISNEVTACVSVEYTVVNTCTNRGMASLRTRTWISGTS